MISLTLLSQERNFRRDGSSSLAPKYNESHTPGDDGIKHEKVGQELTC